MLIHAGRIHARLVAMLALVAALALPSIVQAQTYVFWGEYNSGKIKRADLDGNNVTTIAFSQFSNWTMTTDRVNQRVYWAPYGSVVRGSNFDGTGLTSIQTLVTNGEGVAADPVSGNVYFNYYSPTGLPGTVGRGIDYAKSDGSEFLSSGAHHLYDDPNITADTVLAIDSTAGVIYEGRSANIYKSPLDGSGSLVALGNISTPYIFGMAIDPAHNKVYWTSTDIRVANLDGSVPTTSIPTGTLYNPHGIAVDSANGMLYFVQDGNGGSVHSGVYSVPVTGGTPTMLVDLQGVEAFPRGLTIFVPEPTSLALLAIGGALVLRRRPVKA